MNSKKQNAIAELLLNTPCTCPSECDRHWLIHHPDYQPLKLERAMKDPVAIAKFLAADYNNLECIKHHKSVCDLPASGKYIILSDLHQGSFAWSYDEHDFFWQNKELYHHLLEYYFEKGYTLIEAGDVEEFWLKRKKITFDEQWAYQLQEFPKLYEMRKKFHAQNRYIKLRGNHDNLWYDIDRVQKYLKNDIQLQNLKVYEFVTLGTDFLILHGHQVDKRNRDCNSKKGLIWTKFGGLLERFTDTVFFGLKKPPEGWTTHPQSKLIHSYKIEKNISHMERLNLIMAKLAKKLNQYLIYGHNHAPKCLPDGFFLFNSGCGVFEGIIYGIEIDYDEDVLRLVDWNDDHGISNEPVILCVEPISGLRKRI